MFLIELVIKISDKCNKFKNNLNINIRDMSQFDQDCITYTQEGRILQIEYAVKAV